MEVTFIKLSDARHAVEVTRDDGSTQRVELATRSFLHHDFAHFAVEAELKIKHGFWGSVAAGAPLDGVGLEGDDIGLAERVAAPVQTLIRGAAGPEQIQHALETIAPEVTESGTGAAVHERLRRLLGHWRATPYRGQMIVTWPPSPLN